MEVWFYHLQSQPLERALPALVEKAVARGWRVIVQTVDDLRLRAVDDLLWTYAPERFLPHGIGSAPNAARQPVLVTCEGGNPNGAAARFYVDGAVIAPDDATYERVILLFDGRNEDELDAARRQWSRLKGDGVALAYWQQSDGGQWTRRT